MPVTLDQLTRIAPHASRRKINDPAWLPAFNGAMAAYGVDTPLRMAAFVAQIAHESGDFNYMAELWGPTPAQRRYEPQSDLATRLGNRDKGDGFRFRGRGPIQITGRSNYERYGKLLELDLVGNPDQASTPDVGFRIAGLYWQRNGLNELADQGQFTLITRRINGGVNGLAQRQAYYRTALSVFGVDLPQGNDLTAGAGRAGAGRAPKLPALALARGQEALSAEPVQPEVPAKPGKGLSAKKGKESKGKAAPAPLEDASRTFDARPDTMDFRDRMYVPTLVEVPPYIPLGDYLDHAVPILDQGREGACTGYGLATVANYLLRRRRIVPDPMPVSPRMFYDLARRYDEWPGEAYSGSSARGAMKGWQKHGVCPEELYPSSSRKAVVLNDALTSEARRRPLGAYFRVNHKDLVAMHSAIAEVGILYATASVHQGWSDVGPDGVIALSDQMLGGHAFAIVAYDAEGFWLQNSWGTTWGQRGFARISYDDWLRNGTDVWVARLGAPVSLHTVEATATAHASTSGESAAYAYVDLRPHIVSVGNNGQLRAGGDYGITPDDLAHIFESDIPRVTADWDKVRILLYAHGGLVSESAAVQRVADYRPRLLAGQVYPLAFVWKTDYWTTLSNLLEDALRRRRPEGLLDAAKDFMLDRLDDALEPLARMLTGKAEWSEMKQNALATSGPGGAGELVVGHLAALRKKFGNRLEIHIAGHSAGSILHAGLLDLLIKSKFDIASCTLWAPACTVDLFNAHYAAPIKSGRIKRFHLYVLTDQVEQDDNCGRIYNKSLLYLVSHAFEERARIPGFFKGEPILGMACWLQEKLPWLLAHPSCQVVFAPGQAGALRSQARHHGDFDDDPDTVDSTFAFLIGDANKAAWRFRPSGEHLRERRMQMDVRTRLLRA